VANTGTEKPLSDSLYGELSPQQFAVAVHLVEAIREAYMLKASFENPDALKSVERYTILSAIDRLWQEHLYHMDHLRNAISLRAYGQRDPLLEYKAEAYKTFDKLMLDIKTQICHNIFRSASSLMAFQQFLQNLSKVHTVHDTSSVESGSVSQSASAPTNQERIAPKRQPVRRHPTWAGMIPALVAAVKIQTLLWRFS
jgi:preprotein translocase subunit SecA